MKIEQKKWKKLFITFDNEILFRERAGHYGNFIGEICFNTSITGYQEILTDPFTLTNNKFYLPI